MATDLLTQKEAADRLRRSVRHVERLRAGGELEYLPGRPVMIPAAGLEAYIARKLCREKTKGPISRGTGPGDTKSVGRKLDDRSAARRAHQIFSRLKKS